MLNCLQRWPDGWWKRDMRHRMWKKSLRDSEDPSIWRYALENKAILLSKDEDFAVRVQQSQSGPVVVWLRIGNCSNSALKVWFAPLLPAILEEIEHGNRIIEVR